ncbi:hypothetical protein RE628_02360 [Paenibacillus sp. D2_2]|uniref:hypothetical protein n=1 Tax=Paenibacillus sp. D2_2 TaxID=3073092 RepID=UPI0028155A0E|nr:hypothetical protein [Paenibacillus sp. D2_2]WMT41418.1 hypothetical protein RE628_02360 [Paenibacillus sp. D2_2]
MKKSEHAKKFIDSLIPMGLIFGCAIGVIVGIFFKPSILVFTVSIGSGIGLLLGAIAYGIYGKKNHSDN